ncbi:MAG: GerW family sporulation protein [Clostridia bacterium]|nr:GerW family sporulation protein [Clostridia bacterium]
MSEHPIEGLMVTAMNSIQDMIDVNTIIGEPIETANNVIIIPISKVSFGFAAGGSEFKGETLDEYTKKDKEEAIQYRLPFGGGSGAGVSINPIAFLVVQSNNVKLLPVEYSSSIDKLLDYVPEMIEKASNTMSKCIQNKREDAQKIVKEIQKNVKKEEEKQKEKKKKQAKQEKKHKIENRKKDDADEFEYDEIDDIKDEEDEIDYTQYDD